MLPVRVKPSLHSFPHSLQPIGARTHPLGAGRLLIGQHPRGLSVTRCSISPGGTNNKEASAVGLAVK
ncbi:hypothetical protein QQF64_020982 [Cirrhinus molitorella]|uniref:Uncharacterized protein n=1 Tax=Cirrhinus molitorella TaxID=172907 RepID=A0ABR3LAR4_9TELE